jgi:ABC-type transport system involved in multi-copper enzyme maturation permease subunit
MRWGPGPVFVYECLAGSRRWQHYALRSAGVAVLLLAMGMIALSVEDTARSVQAYAELGAGYFYVLIGVELALVMLAAPAATAGAICLDRARGTLEHMLMTDLSDTEIVVGKLAARLMPVLGLVACSWPVMAISSLLGGIDPIALTFALAVILAVAALGCTLALALSVWARKPHEVILCTYTVFIAGLLLWPVWAGLALAGACAAPPPWTLLANPFYVAFAPYTAPATLQGWDYAGFFGAVLGAAAVLIILAVWRTRPVARRGPRVASKGARLRLLGRLARWLPGPSLDRNPVLWREWHRARPSAWMLAILALLMGTTAALCLIGAVVIWCRDMNRATPGAWATAGLVGYVLHAIFGLLLLSAVAPTSMSEERQRGSLDLLAVTALSTRAIVVGKWLGMFRLAIVMAIAPGLMALAMATYSMIPPSAGTAGPPPGFQSASSLGARIYGVIVVIATIVAHGALLTSAGLALAVWIKRQSRAIAASVALFVLITVAWPIVVSFAAEDLASLSPAVSLIEMASFLIQHEYSPPDRGFLWWAALWTAELFALALGLLWLTAVTFDQCFDRPGDRPRRISIRAALVVVLAMLIGAGSLFAALDAWIGGVLPRDPGPWTVTGISAYALLLALGMVLAATVAIARIPARRPRPAGAPDEVRAIASRPSVWSQWWGAFRLVILLAIGPGILALALATAHKAILLVAKTTTLPSGATEITWEQPDPALANVERIGEVRLGRRLSIAALLIVTMLVHGAACVTIGLALATAIQERRRALVAGIGVGIALALGVSLHVATAHHGYGPDAGLWNFKVAAGSLLLALVTRVSPNIREIVWLIMLWDLVVAIVAIGVFSWTNWARQRRSVRDSRATAPAFRVG